MDFIDRIKQISEQIAKLREQIQTEEATKNAFIKIGAVHKLPRFLQWI